jgi:hypothetical protein
MLEVEAVCIVNEGTCKSIHIARFYAIVILNSRHNHVHNFTVTILLEVRSLNCHNGCESPTDRILSNLFEMKKLHKTFKLQSVIIDGVCSVNRIY